MERRGIIPDAGQLKQVGPVDLIVGVPGCTDSAAVRAARETWRQALQTLRAPVRMALLHADPGTPGEPGDLPAEGKDPVALLYAPLVDGSQPELLGTAYSDTVRGVLQIARQLETRAACVLGTLSTAVSADDAARLLEPVLEQRVDLMIPRHETRLTEGLITRGIVGPLTRALFGIRLHDPMVVNFACSAALAARLEGRPANGPGGAAVWPAIAAVCGGMSVGEVSIRRPDPATGQADLGTVFATLLGSLFADVERHAACWQRIRASRPASATAGPSPAPGLVQSDPPVIDTARMVEAFHSAFSSLAGIWSMAFPPATLLELKKLTRVPAAQFQVPDDLWARIVFDVALGYRLHTMSRDHLLRSFVPLYLAWVASWVMRAGADAAEGQQERLCVAFEQQKPYLLSRWRWPDRFSP